MNVVDSSGWLEYFADGPNADFFAGPIEDVDNLIVPTISLLEVFKRVFQQRGEDAALQAVAIMRQGKVIDLTDDIAIFGAKIGYEKGLPLADSVILATAYRHNSVLWTQDSDFKGLESVQYIASE
jgi:predicted nucleic acid-binding protein